MLQGTPEENHCILLKRHRHAHGAEPGPDPLTTGASCPVAQAGLKLMTILLPQPAECWDNKQTSPCWLTICFFPELTSMGLYKGKNS